MHQIKSILIIATLLPISKTHNNIMKLSLLLTAALASVTTAETSEHKPTSPSKSSKRGKNSKKGKYPFKDVVRSYLWCALINPNIISSHA